MSGTPRDPESNRDGSSGNFAYRSQGEYGTRMNGGPVPVGGYSDDLAAFQEVLPKRYQILREIGRGGMGQVLLALDRGPKLDRNDLVAIKRMLGPILSDSASVKRFYDEVALARELRHPNVVKMYHSDETHLGPYIVMEYIAGKDLGVYIQERGPLGESQAVEWFTKLAEALDEGHRKGLIHRDIKPSNILISKDGEPYLADFGIARRISAMDKTGTGMGAGTIEYMSLEQLRNSRPEKSQDIYSFGATLFHAVEGHPPFGSTNLVDFITRLASETAPRATRVSTKLADRIASCLAKNSAERPGSCRAVLSSLVEESQVVGSPPPKKDHEQPLPKVVVEPTPVPVSRPEPSKYHQLPMHALTELYFCEELTEHHYGRPVGICSHGVMVYHFPEMKDRLSVLPFSEISEIRITGEKRIHRFIGTTIILLILGFFTCLLFLMFQSSLRINESYVFKIFYFSVIGYLLVLKAIAILRYFGKLGYYFAIHSGRYRRSFYFDSETWETKKSGIKSLLASSPHAGAIPENL